MRRLAIAFVLGCVLAAQAPRLPAPGSSAAALGVAVLAAVRPVLRLPAAMLAGGCWLALRAGLRLAHDVPPDLPRDPVVVDGVIRGLPEWRAGRWRFAFVPERTPPALAGVGPLRVSWYPPAPPLAAGERWRLTLRVRPRRALASPGAFDYARWLVAAGFAGSASVVDGASARRLAPASPGAVARAREAVRAFIVEQVPERPRAALLVALATGLRAGIDERQWAVLRASGTAHLMAISGLHIGLVAGAVWWLARRLWGSVPPLAARGAGTVAAVVPALAAAAAYAALAGFSVPTRRALVMLAVVAVCTLAGTGARPASALALAAFAVVLLDPLAVLMPGWWLSFAAVAVLLLAAAGRPAGEPRWRALAAAQLALTVGLAPVTVAWLGAQPLVAPLVNLLAVPWTAVAVLPPLLGGVVLAGLWPGGGAALLALAERALALLWWAVERAALVSVSLTPPPRAWALPCAALGVAMLLLPRGVPGRRLGVLWLLPLIAVAPPPLPPGAFEVQALDVGQGLAAIVRTARHALLFDAGPRYRSGFDTGAAVVVPALRAAALERVDRVVVSHGDIDHRGGLGAVMSSLPVGLLLASEPARVGHGAQRCRAGSEWRWDGVRFRFLHPPAGERWRGNDGSCVLQVTSPWGSALLAGDIEARAERALVARHGGALASELLLVPHHGSRTSSSPEFVASVAPTVAVFPAGFGNRYGFPSAAVWRRYAASRWRLSTGDAGTVTVRFLPGQASVSSWRAMHPAWWRAPPPVPVPRRWTWSAAAPYNRRQPAATPRRGLRPVP